MKFKTISSIPVILQTTTFTDLNKLKEWFMIIRGFTERIKQNEWVCC